jgi:hypothetical protein
MNTKTIQAAIDLLTKAINDDPVILKVALCPRDVEVLTYVCKMDISIPELVHDEYKHVQREEVKVVLRKLLTAAPR